MLLLQGASVPAPMVLKTQHYVATIHLGCAGPKCDPPVLDVMDASGIHTARFPGRQVTVACGKKECPVEGYEFSTLTVRYFLSMDGRFSITSGTNTIADEQGTWIGK